MISKTTLQLHQSLIPANQFPGGLLICLPREHAAAYCEDIKKREGYPAWIVGEVVKGDRTATLVENPTIIEVPEVEEEGEL